MRRRRFGGLHLLLPLVFAGCTVYIGPYDNDTGGTANEPGVVVSPDEARRAREEEAWWYTSNVIYKGGEVLYSFELPSGDIVDFINRDTLPALPYEIPALPFALEALPPGVEFGLTELEQIPELLELAVIATPFHRPTFWSYISGETDATSIEDYLARYQMPGQPVAADRLYAGLSSPKPNRGISGYVNQFRPEVESFTFSLIELTVACPADGPVQEQVGVVVSVDKANPFGKNQQRLADNELRLHIEYANVKAGYSWDNLDGQFVANPIRRHQPGEIVPASVLDEKVVENLLAIFQSPTGDWWIAYNGELLGYYPASLFTMLNGGGCRSAWYGEVAQPTQTNPGWAKTEMGSGEFAEAGLLNAAHVRNLRYYDLTWAGVEPTEDPPFSQALTPNKPLCYNRSKLTHIPAPWDSTYLFLGGPGGKNPGCTWP